MHAIAVVVYTISGNVNEITMEFIREKLHNIHRYQFIFKVTDLKNGANIVFATGWI